MTEQTAYRSDTDTCRLIREPGEEGAIHIYRAFLAFVPGPNAVTTLC